MNRAAIALIALAGLTGCDLLFPEDPRLGVEQPAACLARVEQELRFELANLQDGDRFEPTYTYDITKLGLEAIQNLSASRSDEIKGTRIDQSTNETSTAVDVFMQQPVDENGAFFLGRDPALYRVRGEALPLADIIPAGCERQQANMRLIQIDFTRTGGGASAANPDDASTENENSN
ncbi:hypothetical protein [Qipengyuania sp. ASV99]|uniref:hypothetical protein n=1 Tax=Qipengyuania sp. ASV99 TaxID=3399681 RepID=UPI003A4C7A7F